MAVVRSVHYFQSVCTVLILARIKWKKRLIQRKIKDSTQIPYESISISISIALLVCQWMLFVFERIHLNWPITCHTFTAIVASTTQTTHCATSKHCSKQHLHLFLFGLQCRFHLCVNLSNKTLCHTLELNTIECTMTCSIHSVAAHEFSSRNTCKFPMNSGSGSQLNRRKISDYLCAPVYWNRLKIAFYVCACVCVSIKVQNYERFCLNAMATINGCYAYSIYIITCVDLLNQLIDSTNAIRIQCQIQQNDR